MNHHPHCGDCGSSCCLKVSDLSVRIDTDEILEHVNLHIHCGQMVALIGPNGAGKSTLIKAILGQRSYEGSITFSTPENRRERLRIGYVPQSPVFDRADPVTVQDLFVSWYPPGGPPSCRCQELSGRKFSPASKMSTAKG